MSDNIIMPLDGNRYPIPSGMTPSGILIPHTSDLSGSIMTSELSGFATINIDTVDSGGSTMYTGYQAFNGWWYIQKTMVDGFVTSYSFISGISNYSTAWEGRSDSTYSDWANASQVFLA